MVWQKGGAKGCFLQRALEGAVVNALGLANYNRVKGKVKAKALAKSTARRVQSRGRWLFHLLLGGLPTGQGSSRHMGRKSALPLLQASIRHSPTTPLELTTEWAYKAKRASKDKGVGKGKSKGKGSGQDSPAAVPTGKAKTGEQLKQFKKGRLAELKASSENTAPPPSLQRLRRSWPRSSRMTESTRKRTS